MGVYPSKYNKEEFREFLEKNNVKDSIIDKFNSLPEKIKHNDCEYDLNIAVTWFSIGNTFYNFELNYYSKEKIEFLFSYKIFNDVEVSINNLLCELYRINVVEKPCP
jgi:hypothetical protein